MKYVYIFEDGQVAVSNTPPTPTDLIEIGQGCLQVLEVSVLDSFKPTLGASTVDGVGIQEIDEDGSRYEPNEAIIHNEEGDDFHVPAS